MEFISKDLKGKPVRHTFDRKVFLRYFGFMLIWPIFVLLCPIPLILFGIKLDFTDYAFGKFMPILTGPFFAGLYFIRLYTYKGSDVFTVPGCVLYRKRKLFSSLFGSCVHYVIYCITSVESMRAYWRDFAVVWGDIKAAYVLKDGKSIFSYKKCRRVAIPYCFTDMDVILKTLEEINPQSSSTKNIRF